jgi:hypothetical protein
MTRPVRPEPETDPTRPIVTSMKNPSDPYLSTKSSLSSTAIARTKLILKKSIDHKTNLFVLGAVIKVTRLLFAVTFLSVLLVVDWVIDLISVDLLRCFNCLLQNLLFRLLLRLTPYLL